MGENYFGITDTGRQRINNEDRFIARPVFNESLIIACVIDGVGGYVGGEVAAQLTADAIINGLDKIHGSIPDQILLALQNANERIMKEKEVNPQNDKMACVVTLAVVDIEKNRFYFAHVGDTRLYLFRDGSLIKITKDHSSVGFLEESGRLTEEAAMAHPMRNEINKALGFEAQVSLPPDFIDQGESPFLPGDTILLCSDGLTDMVTSAEIILILNNEEELKAKGQRLIDAANGAGGKDNITVVLAKNDKSPVQHEITRPAVIQKKAETNANGQTKIIEKEVTKEKPNIKAGSNNTNIWLLFLFVVFFAGFMFLLFRQNKKTEDVIKPALASTLKQRSNRERIFLDSINSALNKTVHLIDSQAFFVSDTLMIKNDSLHIIGNGISFVRDSAYNGPAFVLSSNCKYILFDSVTFENFSTGIIVLNKGLHFKNVQFKNCNVPVLFQQQFLQGKLVSGNQSETMFNYKDSAKK